MKKQVRTRAAAVAILLALVVGGNAAAAPSSPDSFWGHLSKRVHDFGVKLYSRLSPPLP